MIAPGGESGQTRRSVETVAGLRIFGTDGALRHAIGVATLAGLFRGLALRLLAGLCRLALDMGP